MAKLQEYNGRYCESEFEYAFLSFLEAEGWHYLHGNSIPRENKTAVLYADDMEQFLSKTNVDLTADEIHDPFVVEERLGKGQPNRFDVQIPDEVLLNADVRQKDIDIFQNAVELVHRSGDVVVVIV